MNLEIRAKQDTPILTDERGNLLNKPVIPLSAEEARMLRAYKKFLDKNHMREMNFCNRCWDHKTIHDGMHGHVTDNEIVFDCRCRTLLYQGMTL